MKPRYLVYALGFLLIAGCTTFSLKELQRTSFGGSAFHQALGKGYLIFAESEAEQYDWTDSEYFASKGLKVANGQPVPPEAVEHWDVPEAVVPELLTARKKLHSVLTEKAVNAHPKLAAKAQLFFDCWLEQQEEAWQPEHISGCKQGFYSAIDALEKALAPKVEATPLLPVPTSYLVFFEWAKHKLTEEANAIVDQVVALIKGQKENETPYRVVLHGHTDRSGSKTANLELSQQRAQTVKAALLAQGVAKEQIEHFAFGETDPRVATEDGMRHPANRRVEIFLNP